MQFGIIKERKNPPDRRVVFTPEELVRLQKEYPEATIKVESSDIRVFNDEAYKNLCIEYGVALNSDEYKDMKNFKEIYLMVAKKHQKIKW
jgi:hypothetical protein